MGELNGTVSQYQAVRDAIASLESSNPIARGLHAMIGNWIASGDGSGTQEIKITVTE